MATKELEFSIRDLIIALLKEQNIHSGYWGLRMHFTGTGACVAKGDESEIGLPGLVVTVSKVTLVQVKASDENGIDASQFNLLQ